MEDGVLCSTLDLVIVHAWMYKDYAGLGHASVKSPSRVSLLARSPQTVSDGSRRHQQGQQLASAKQAMGMPAVHAGFPDAEA